MARSSPPPPSEVGALAPSDTDAAGPGPAASSPRGRGGGRRALWRVHAVSGLIAFPVLVLLATTGLVQLHGDSIDRLLDPGVHLVRSSPAETSLDDQVTAAVRRHPDAVVLDVTTADGPTSPTVVRLAGTPHDQLVYVDPHTARVLGDRSADGGLVALATRLHAHLGVDTGIVSLPTPAALVDDGSGTVPIQLGDALLEIAGVWTLVMVGTGLMLWRRPTPARPRGISGGRAVWRRRHVTPGAAAAALVVVAALSGMCWSTYWGTTWRRLAEATGDRPAVETPMSAMDMAGMSGMDMSDMSHMSMTPIALNEVAAVAAARHLAPGYRIVLPVDSFGADGSMMHGAYELTTAWPLRTAEHRSVWIDQFSGEVLADRGTDDQPPLVRATEAAKETHVGVQFGAVSRGAMTLACLAVDWSAISGLALWWRRRRRAGGLGLPRRTATLTASAEPARLSRGVRLAAVALGVAFPLWGASALAIAGLDRVVVRPLARRRTRSAAAN